MLHVRRLLALTALLALAGGVASQGDSSGAVTAQTSSDYDAGENTTLINSLTADSPFANAVFTATNLCTPTCQQAFDNMTRATSTGGNCDKCGSNSGNPAIASWSTASTACGNCAARWNAYNASCNTPATPANKPCFNFQVIADGSNPTSLASLMTLANGSVVGGDVYDFLSGFTSLIGSCSDAVDYVVNYALSTAYDPATGGTGSVCPTSKITSNTTCSAACNSAWNLIQYYCVPGAPVQYDFNGMPDGTLAPVNTFLPIETVVNMILNGTAFGPNNDDYAGTGVQNLPLALGDASCVVSAWMGQVLPDGSTSIDLNGPAPSVPPGNANGAPALVTQAPVAAGPTGAPAMTCSQAASAMNLSTASGNCNQCVSDTGSPLGCKANCAACGQDFSNMQAACGATGDSTFTLTYSVVSAWADNLLQVTGNFTFGDCYLLAITLAEPLAATCSDYFDYMTSYSQTNMFVNPQNPSQTGPACPTVASDSVAAPGTCPPACQADLANLANCNAASQVAGPGGSTMSFANAWQQFVSGGYAAIDPFYNTFKTNTGSAAYNLSGCATFLTNTAPGVQPAGTVNNAVLPATAPNCSTARATLLNSTQLGACDKCTSNTGDPNNCFTGVSGDPNCNLCGVQFDAYTAACNETYADIGEAMVGNLRSTTAGGDCFDMFNQIAQSSIGTPNFNTDACSDTWDSIVQYSETVLNDGPGSQLGPNCPTQPGALCSAACQNDLAQLNTYCTAAKVVQWTGYGAPGYVTATGAPAGTTVTALNAWAYFVNGTATAPIGNAIIKGKAVAVPFALGNCTLPGWLPANATAAFKTVLVNASFSISLPATMTLAQLYAKNNAAGGALEATIAASIGSAPNAVTILWSAMGISVAGRRLLAASTIQYQVATTQAGAAAVQANVASFNPATALTSTFTGTLNITGVSVSATSAAVAPAARVTFALLAAAAVASIF